MIEISEQDTPKGPMAYCNEEGELNMNGIDQFAGFGGSSLQAHRLCECMFPERCEEGERIGIPHCKKCGRDMRKNRDDDE